MVDWMIRGLIVGSLLGIGVYWASVQPFFVYSERVPNVALETLRKALIGLWIVTGTLLIGHTIFADDDEPRCVAFSYDSLGNIAGCDTYEDELLPPAIPIER